MYIWKYHSLATVIICTVDNDNNNDTDTTTTDDDDDTNDNSHANVITTTRSIMLICAIFIAFCYFS